MTNFILVRERISLAARLTRLLDLCYLYPDLGLVYIADRTVETRILDQATGASGPSPGL